MANREPFAEDEWYHCYNRGVDKRKVFLDEGDFERFMLLLYVSNGTNRVHISNTKKRTIAEITQDASLDRGEPLVAIGAYCLMPNHIHLVLKQVKKGGLALFMQKVFTGYTMYFNKKYQRTGSLFAGVFKSKHLYDDRYFKKALSYIHLNTVELFEKNWKSGVGDLKQIEKQLATYKHSSLSEFNSNNEEGLQLLDKNIFELFDSKPTTKQILTEAQEYYLHLPKNMLDTSR